MTPFNLAAEAAAFAAELSELLNSTVCNGIRLTPVELPTDATRYIVGCGLGKHNISDVRPIPISLRRKAHVYLLCLIRLSADDESEHLMATSSVFGLLAKNDVDSVLIGGRRNRPSLEDLIEFVVAEGLGAPRDGWEDRVREGRERFRVRQLRAAIRRDPETVVEYLRQHGYEVTDRAE
jgi:hypothetical protein